MLNNGSYLGFYLDASEADFDRLAGTLSGAGFEVVPKELDQSLKDRLRYIAYLDYSNDSGQGSVTYISQAPALSIDAPHLLVA